MMMCSVIVTVLFVLNNGTAGTQVGYLNKDQLKKFQEELKKPSVIKDLKKKGVEIAEIADIKHVKEFDCNKGPDSK